MMRITNIIAGVRCSRALRAPCIQHASCHASSGWQLGSTLVLKVVRHEEALPLTAASELMQYHVVKASLIDSFMPAATRTCHTH